MKKIILMAVVITLGFQKAPVRAMSPRLLIGGLLGGAIYTHVESKTLLTLDSMASAVINTPAMVKRKVAQFLIDGMWTHRTFNYRDSEEAYRISCSGVPQGESFSDLMHSASVSANPTPTEIHLRRHGENIKMAFGSWYNQDPNFRKTVNDIIKLERFYADKGYYTFVHGQEWKFHRLESLYRSLKGIIEGNRVQDFRYAFIKKMHMKDNAQIQAEEEKMHKQIMQTRGDSPDKEIRFRQLFLNNNFFGNTCSVGYGASTVHYYAHNSNALNNELSAGDVFSYFGLEEHYKIHKKEFDALMQEHNELVKSGNVLFVAIPHDKTPQYVTYNLLGTSWFDVAFSKANLRYGYYIDTALRNNAPFVNGAMTNDIKIILDSLKTDAHAVDNSDHIEFILALTDTAGLDWKSGIKFHSVNASDPEKLAAWQAKLDALMAKVEAEFKTSWKQSLKARELGHGDLLDAVRATQKYASAQQK